MMLPATAASYGLGAVRDRDLAATADAAASFLLQLQLPAGGWTWEEDGARAGQNFGGIVGEPIHGRVISEVQAEALAALIVAGQG